jgi:prepilin-type N-terminal cleavage/methylation domain-containing protein
MKNILKKGFTLSEMLITLTVVGVLAVLVIPGLIRDTTNRAQISLLQSSVESLNTAVQNELIRTNATNIVDTNIYNSPEKFLKSLDVSKTTTACSTEGYFATSYKDMNGDAASSPTCDAAGLLKTGVVVGLKNSYLEQDATAIIIDINGDKEPNIVGMDYFILELTWNNDKESGKHLGDIGGSTFNNQAADSDDLDTLKEKCSSGGAEACYYALELSGFDYNYLK